MVKDNNEIVSVYGAFPNHIWNGGRLITDVPLSIDERENMIKEYNNLGIEIKFTYTNNQLTEKHLVDLDCNMSLDMTCNGKNGIICNSPILEKYIRDKYGDKFKYDLSATWTTGQRRETIQEKKKDYELVCLPPDHSMNIDMIKEIGVKQALIIVDETCTANCIYRKLHYDMESTGNLSKNIFWVCLNKAANPRHVPDDKLLCLTEEEVDHLIDIGVENFKIASRRKKSDVLVDSVCKYIIKEEYKKQFKDEMNMVFDEVKRVSTMHWTLMY
ncbi:MAG: hypothetical protein GY853_16400 [PVC group bacterium]|nr:hypothetical protein [PVC group bacterium]